MLGLYITLAVSSLAIDEIHLVVRVLLPTLTYFILDSRSALFMHNHDGLRCHRKVVVQWRGQ